MEMTFWQRQAITADHRKELYRALGKIAKDGLPMFDSLDRMGESFTATRHPLGPLIQAVLPRMRGGGPERPGSRGNRTFGSEVFGLVPDDESMLIQAGEMSARTAAGFEHAATSIETKAKLRSTIGSALVEPLMYIAAAIALLVFLSVKLIPQFEKSRPRALWPPSAQLLGTIADHVTLLSVGVVLVLAGIAAALMWLGPNWIGEWRERFDRHVFPFTLMSALTGAAFLTSLAGYISAGLAFSEAVENLRATGTPYMKWQCHKVQMSMKRGEHGSNALCDLSMIPLRYHWVIKVYALSTDTSHAYLAIAEELVEGTQKTIKWLFSYVISKTLLLGISGFLFWFWLSLFGVAMGGSAL
jgi:type II secretory pathway component PulF